MCNSLVARLCYVPLQRQVLTCCPFLLCAASRAGTYFLPFSVMCSFKERYLLVAPFCYVQLQGQVLTSCPFLLCAASKTGTYLLPLSVLCSFKDRYLLVGPFWCAASNIGTHLIASFCHIRTNSCARCRC